MNERSDPQVDSLRIPPHSIEAEQSVLGGLLLDNSAWDKIADADMAMFVVDSVRKLDFEVKEAILRLKSQYIDPDTTKVLEKLQDGTFSE